MTWRFADPSVAIDDWIKRDRPSEDLMQAALGRLLDLTSDPLPDWSGKVLPGVYMADISEAPLVVAMYALDQDHRVIYLKMIDTLL